MIVSGEIDPRFSVDVYLVHRFSQDIVGSLIGDVRPEDQFFLKHPDDQGDHTLVNDSYDISGVIGWEWT